MYRMTEKLSAELNAKQATRQNAKQATKQVTQQTKKQSSEQIPTEIIINMDNRIPSKKDNSFNFDLSQKRLQEAFIWSEILGKPLSKRRKRT